MRQQRPWDPEVLLRSCYGETMRCSLKGTPDPPMLWTTASSGDTTARDHAMSTNTQTAVGTAHGVDDKPDNYFDWARPELIRQIQPGARTILDVGCGRGALGAALKAQDPTLVVHGIEYVQEAVDVAQTRLDSAIRLDLNDFDGLDLPEGSVDAMVFGDVLEHLLDPEAALATLLPYLADDGRVIASIPNVKHWSVVLPLLAGDAWTYTDAGLLDRTHVHFFTLSEATQMFSRVGLTTTHAIDTNTIVSEQAGILDPLLDALERYGAERAFTEQLLNAYQYILSVGR